MATSSRPCAFPGRLLPPPSLVGVSPITSHILRFASHISDHTSSPLPHLTTDMYPLSRALSVCTYVCMYHSIPTSHTTRHISHTTPGHAMQQDTAQHILQVAQHSIALASQPSYWRGTHTQPSKGSTSDTDPGRRFAVVFRAISGPAPLSAPRPFSGRSGIPVGWATV